LIERKKCFNPDFQNLLIYPIEEFQEKSFSIKPIIEWTLTIDAFLNFGSQTLLCDISVDE